MVHLLHRLYGVDAPANRNIFRVLFDKIVFVHLKNILILIFSIINGQPREPALCQLYRRTFVPYAVTST